MEVIFKKELCNDLWCRCPLIEIIKMEDNSKFIKISDDFGNSILLTYSHLDFDLSFCDLNDCWVIAKGVLKNEILIHKDHKVMIIDFLSELKKEERKNGKKRRGWIEEIKERFRR